MKRKKLLAIMCAAALAAGCAAGVSAEEISPTAAEGGGQTAPANIAIYNYTSDLSISGGIARCEGITYVQSGYTASTYVELQVSDGSWRTVATWSGGTSAGGSYYVSGGSYRVRTTHRAYQNGSLVETVYSYDY